MTSDVIELQQTIRLARWSAVLGTIGLLTSVFGFGVVFALIGIGCAVVALNHVSSLHSQDIQGIALVGLLAGVLALLLFPLLLATAVPRFIAARQIAAHEQCYKNLLSIDATKQKWARQYGAPDFARPTFRQLFGPDGITGRTPHCPSGGKYSIGAVDRSARCSVEEHNEPVGASGPPRQLQFSSQGRSAFAALTFKNRQVEAFAPRAPLEMDSPRSARLSTLASHCRGLTTRKNIAASEGATL
jgi:hypothetical protein